MKTESIFQFKDYQAYFQHLRSARVAAGKRRLTYRDWARRIGYRSPRGIAMVFKGQRLPSAEMVARLASDLKLSAPERKYLTLLVRLDRLKRRGKDVREVLLKLEALDPLIHHK